MAYPSGEGWAQFDALQPTTAPAAEIIQQVMTQAYDTLTTEHPLGVLI